MKTQETFLPIFIFEEAEEVEAEAACWFHLKISLACLENE